DVGHEGDRPLQAVTDKQQSRFHTFDPPSSDDRTCFTWLIGMAKPTPTLPSTGLSIELLMPITSPCTFTSGPPELPGLMAASVWMKSEPEPCSICGRRRSCGKKSSNPGGSRVSLARSRFSDRMNTTAGLTCSATATNASLRSAMGLAAGSGLLGGAVVCWAAASGSAAPPFLGRSSDDANASPSTKAIATSDPNCNQSRVRTV